MVTCCVKGCRSNTNSASLKRYFRIPAIISRDEETKEYTTRRRKLWLAQLKLDDFHPTRNWRVCSDHFVNGAPSYARDFRNPDWIPTINLENAPSDGVQGKRKRRRRQEDRAAAAPKSQGLAAKTLSSAGDADLSLDGGGVAATADTGCAREHLRATASPADTALAVTGACAVFGCTNSSEQLQRWWAEPCPEHDRKVGQDGCRCQPPFTLRCFPTKNPRLRDVWIAQIRQMLPEEDKGWEPDELSRVCSVHFAPGVSFPTLQLHPNIKPKVAACTLRHSASGGDAPGEKRRRVEGDPLATSPTGGGGKDASNPRNPAVALADSGTSASPPSGPAVGETPCPPTLDDADLSDSRTCSSSALSTGRASSSRSPCRDCLTKDMVIQHMQSEIWALQEEVEAIKEKLQKSVVDYKAV